MSNSVKDNIAIIIVVAFFFLLGFFTARNTTKSEVKTEYVQLPPIYDTIDSIQIKYKYLPINLDTASLIDYLYSNGKLDYLKSHDTIPTQVDTNAIIREFITKNSYSIELFNIDTLGKCSINAEVQFNQLAHLDYKYTPIQRVNTTTQKPTLGFMVGGGAGVTTQGVGVRGVTLNADLGVIIKDHYVLQYVFQYNTANDLTHNVVLNYKF